MIVKNIKWIGTFFVLLGILLTNLNILFHGFGVCVWTIAGYLFKDRAILTNFGLQVPLFGIGIFNLFL